MKNSSTRASVERKKREDSSLVSLKKPETLHRMEATIMSEESGELKDFLVQHLAMPLKLEKGKKKAAHSDAPGDLFRLTMPASGEFPAEAKLYETYVLQKKKSKSPSK